VSHDPTSYDAKTTPLRPGRVITVSAPAAPVIDSIVATFVARGFRVTSAAGTFPLTLEVGRWYAPYLLWGSVWPSKLSSPARHGVVRVELTTNADSTLAVTIRVYYAWSAQLMSPIVLDAINDLAVTLAASGVLIDAGPIIATKGRL
jgi:hypothetical protein